jgi:ribosome-binding factor A
MSSKRMAQIGEQIREHVAMMLVKGDLADPRLRAVTINMVRMTPDLQTAKVYYSVYGDDATKAAVKRGLSQASGYIRRSLGGAMKLRYTPDVVFFYDDTVERAHKIHELLARVRQEDEGLQETPATEVKED